MNLKLVIAASLLAATPVLAQGQMSGPPPKAAPKPTVAQVQKVLADISRDKAKVATYCDLNKVNQQMSTVDEKDQKKMQALGEKADSLMQKLGPDYAKVMEGLDSVDENSAEGKQYAALFQPLDAQCK
jgi:Skp family chaperone for outer membrane proteins